MHFVVKSQIRFVRQIRFVATNAANRSLWLLKSRSLPITGALSAVGPRLQRRDQHRVRCSPRVWQPPADRSNRPGWMDDPPAALFEADIRPVPAAATPPPREWSRVAHGNSRACNLALALTRSAVSKPSLKEP